MIYVQMGLMWVSGCMFGYALCRTQMDRRRERDAQRRLDAMSGGAG